MSLPLVFSPDGRLSISDDNDQVFSINTATDAVSYAVDG